VRIRSLRAFRNVIEKGSVSAAARHLNLSQPAVSRILSSLEEELGFSLFERKGRRLIATADGYKFYIEIQSILSAIEKLPIKAEAIRNKSVCRIRLISMPRLVSNVALPVIANIREKYPDLEIDLEAKTGADFKLVLAKLNFDIALAVLPVEADGVDVRSVATSPLGVVAQRSSPLANRGLATASDLLGEKLVTLDSGTRYREAIDFFFRRASLEPTIATTVPNLEMAITLVEIGGGITFAEPFSLLERHGPNLVWIPLEGAPDISYGIIRPRLQSFSEVENKLVAAIVARMLTATARPDQRLEADMALPL
jgi:DNA-binding transcriptional LysR family regulator